jgi:hypothetical protein
LGLAHASQPTRTTDRHSAAAGRLAERLHEAVNLGFTSNEVGNRGAKLVQALDGGSGRFVYDNRIAPARYVVGILTAHNSILWLWKPQVVKMKSGAIGTREDVQECI